MPYQPVERLLLAAVLFALVIVLALPRSQTDIEQRLGSLHTISPQPATSANSQWLDITPNIHQNAKAAPLPGTAAYTLSQTWQLQHPQYSYTLWNDTSAAQFIAEHYDASYLTLYQSLPRPILKADLFRYMVVAALGGIYTDIDTECLLPLHQWFDTTTIPHLLWLQSSQQLVVTCDATNSVSIRQQVQAANSEPIRAIIGVEVDVTLWPAHYLSNYGRQHQLCQWTFAAAAGHPLMNHVVQYVVEHLQLYTDTELRTMSILELSGPSVWTDAIRHYLIQHYQLPSVDLLLAHTYAMRFGDILILPSNAFGFGPSMHTYGQRIPSVMRNQLASHCPQSVVHHFSGSWKTKVSDELMAEKVHNERIASYREREVDSDDVESRWSQMQQTRLDALFQCRV